MSIPSRKETYDLTHQQSEVLEYITEIAQELSQIAQRAGCDILSRDLRQAILRAHGLGESQSESRGQTDAPQVDQRDRL